MKITKGELTFKNKEKPLALSIPQVLLGKKIYDSYFCGIKFLHVRFFAKYPQNIFHISNQWPSIFDTCN